MKKCIVKFCRHKVPLHHHSDKCGKHKSQAYKILHPIKYTFNKIKQRAKERGHEFTLTIEEFTQFVNSTEYMERKGRSKYSLSIDRKNPTEGYHIWNIRVLPYGENSRKQWVPYFRNWMD